MRPKVMLSLFLLAALPGAAVAEIYKYVDKDGVIRYTDTPPSEDAKPVDLPPLQTYSNDGAVPYDSENEDPDSVLQLQSAGYSRLELTSPAPEQVFNQAEPQVIVSVQLEPDLEEGHRMVFLLDGEPVPAPAGRTSLTLGNLDRGTHSLQAQVMDSRDSVQIQSETISFHLHQPSQLRPQPPNAMPKLP